MSGCDPCGCDGGRGEDQLKQMAELSKNLKEGERLLAPSRRPDGSLRKPIRIRSSYVPQEEVAIYQSKGALSRKEMVASQEVPPGYDPILDGKTKRRGYSVFVKNLRRKSLQAALEKGMNSDVAAAGERIEMVGDSNHGSESVMSLSMHFDDLTVTVNCADNNAPLAVIEDANSAGSGQDIDKRIRTLKKKIRLAEGQQQKKVEKDLTREQLEKLAKLEGWRRPRLSLCHHKL